jgi:hypothetical protein
MVNVRYPLRWEHVLLNETGGLILIIAGKTKAARRQLPMTPEVFTAISARYEQQGAPGVGLGVSCRISQWAR